MDATDSSQTIFQLRDAGRSLMVSLIQSFQLRNKYRGLQFRERVGVITPVTIDLDPLLDLRRRSQQSSSTPCAEKFTAAEAENPDVSPRTGFAPLDYGAWHLAGIFD